MPSQRTAKPVAEIFGTSSKVRGAPAGLANAIRARIESGSLLPETRLPTIRALAKQLGLSRNVVEKAFQLLRIEGLIVGKQRGGTRVTSLTVSAKRHAPRANSDARWYSKGGQSRGESRPVWDLRPGQSYVRSMPLEVWRRACREAGRKLPPSDYGDPAGERPLRQKLAEYLGRSRALSINPDNIVVTAGSGAALGLIARSVVQNGDIVGLEDPGYHRALSEFERAGAKVFLVPVEFNTGHRIDVLPEGRKAPTILHLTPAHQYPLGVRLSAQKRAAVVRWARCNGALIVENDYDQEFSYDAERFPPLSSVAPDCVALVGTFSKSLSPSLRIGFIAGPTQLIELVRTVVARDREHVPWPLQQTLLWLLHSGFVEKNISRNRRHYLQLRNAIREAFVCFVPHIELHGTECGLHAVLRFHQSLDAGEVCSYLRKNGIALELLIGREARQLPVNSLILGYGHLQLAELRSALQAVSVLLRKIILERVARG